MNNTCLQAGQFSATHTGRRGLHCTLWIATRVLNVHSEESRHCLAGFRWAKEYIFIYTDSERTDLHISLGALMVWVCMPKTHFQNVS